MLIYNILSASLGFWKENNKTNMEDVEDVEDSYRFIHPSKMEGRTIKLIRGASQLLKINTVTPKDKLFNFEIETFTKNNKYKFIVLDNYGDEIILQSIYKRLLFHKLFEQNLIIEFYSGKIYSGVFFEEIKSGNIELVLTEFSNLSIPSKYKSRLKELLSSKRPYYFTIPIELLFNFIDKEIGYRELQDNIHVILDFKNMKLDIGRYSHKEIVEYNKED